MAYSLARGSILFVWSLCSLFSSVDPFSFPGFLNKVSTKAVNHTTEFIIFSSFFNDLGESKYLIESYLRSTRAFTTILTRASMGLATYRCRSFPLMRQFGITSFFSLSLSRIALSTNYSCFWSPMYWTYNLIAKLGRTTMSFAARISSCTFHSHFLL